MSINKILTSQSNSITDQKLKEIQRAGSVAARTKKIMDSVDESRVQTQKHLEKKNPYIEKLRNSLKRINIL